MTSFLSGSYDEFGHQTKQPIDGTGAVLETEFRPQQPINVLRIGFICDGDMTGTATVALTRQAAVGGSGGGVLALAVPELVAGMGVWTDALDEIPGNPGEMFEFNVIADATAGTGYYFMQYKPVGLVGDADGRMDDVIRTIIT